MSPDHLVRVERVLLDAPSQYTGVASGIRDVATKLDAGELAGADAVMRLRAMEADAWERVSHVRPEVAQAAARKLAFAVKAMADTMEVAHV